MADDMERHLRFTTRRRGAVRPMVGYRGPLIDPVTLGPLKSCTNCRHFDPQGLPRCAAFPGGIPLPILGGEVAHDRPLPDDHGIQFEPIEWPEEELERARHPERFGY